MAVRCTVVILLAALLACGCGDAGSEAPPPRALWHADPLDPGGPLPDDRLLEAGHPALRPGYYLPFAPAEALNDTARAAFERNAELLATLDGWGSYAPLLVPFSVPLDDDSVSGERFALLPIEPPGEPVAVQAVNHREAAYVELLPAAPLEPSRRHLLAVRAGLRSGGVAVEPPPELGQDDTAQALVAEAAAALGTEPAALLEAVSFTTAAVQSEMVAAAAQVSTAVPAVDFSEQLDNPRWPRGVFARDDFLAYFAGDPSRQAALAAGLAHAGIVAVGSYQSLDFRGPDGVFDPAVVSGQAAPSLMNVELVLVLPDAAEHPPPWPAAVVQHGFGGSAEQVLRWAEMLNAEGMAAIGIDALDHGIRGDLTEFFHFDDMRVARENFRQTVLDQLGLCRVVETAALDLDGQPGPDLDGRCGYFGQSMGGLLGGLFMALAPRSPAGVLDVAGGGLTRILHSPVMEPMVRLLLAPTLGVGFADPAYQELLPIFSWAGQSLMDPGDPINYAALVLRQPPVQAEVSRRVLIQASIGDGFVPNATSRALADAMGVAERDSAASDAAGLSGLWWFDVTDWGIEVDAQGHQAHDMVNLVEDVRRQAGRYLASEGTVILGPTGP